MCWASFKELLTWTILFNNLSRCICITHIHADLNLHVSQRILLVIKSFYPHNKPMHKYYYYSHLSSEEIKSTEGLSKGLKVTQLTSEMAWPGAQVVPMKA